MSTDAAVAEEPKPPSLLEELQSWWEVVSIAQYVSLFREAFNLPEIEIEELENGLIEDTTNGPSAWLEDLVVSLMRASMWTRVNKENWQSLLRKLVARKCPADQETPFPDHKLFYQLGLRAKVDIIYLLCLHRLDKNDITEVMKSMDADALRVQKLGVDDEGSAYWYFYGTRLYKEEPVKEEKSWDEEWTKQKRRSFRIKRKRGRPKKLKNLNSDGESENEDDSKFMNVSEKSRWSVVCDTLEQWIAFAAKFQNSKSKNEKALFQVIQENFLPTLNQIYEEKEKKIQEKLKELLPVRERILTRRETRKLRGEPSPPPATNGYASSEEDQHSRPSLAEDRARRLEERRKRLDEAAAAAEFQQYRKQRHEDRYYDESSDQGSSSRDADEYSNPPVPSSDQSLDLQSQMEKLISHIKIHKDAWPFVHPVSEEEAAGYYDIIKDPVDLSSIEKKLREGAYETVGDLDSDFSQMVSNCEIYNGENHAFSKMAQTLWTIFRKGVSNILDSFPPEQLSNEGSEENSNCSDQMYMPPHKHKKHKKEKKKKKPARGMEALEMLAQASELAVKNEVPGNSSPQNTSTPPPKTSSEPLKSQSPRTQPSVVAPSRVHTSVATSRTQPSVAGPSKVQTSVAPPQKRPCYAPSASTAHQQPSIVRTSLPITSSNFVPVQASPDRTKPLIIRKPPTQQTVSSTSATTLVSNSYRSGGESSAPAKRAAYTTYQSLVGPRTVPTTQQSYSPAVPSSQNLVPPSPGQSNLCLPGSGAVIQKIIIPAGQPIQLQNGQQLIFASSPQGAINRVFNANQGQMRQVSIDASKMVPQGMSGAPVIHVSKEQLERLQLALSQNASQGFAQAAPNSQIVNIPTYILSNQNQGQASVVQQLQMTPTGQMNGQGNG